MPIYWTIGIICWPSLALSSGDRFVFSVLLAAILYYKRT